jgi:hypothetical protein
VYYTAKFEGVVEGIIISEDDDDSAPDFYDAV